MESGLLVDLRSQLNNPDNADLVLTCASGAKLFAASFMLRARSPYFVKMLDSGMKESSTREIRIDASYEAVFAMLKFLYTDELDVPPVVAVELLVLSDMYFMSSLKAKAECLVLKSVDPTTALEFYGWAKERGLKQLEKFTADFIWTNIGQVSRLPIFQEFVKGQTELFLELCRALPEGATIVPAPETALRL
jgi:hypothetical protein